MKSLRMVSIVLVCAAAAACGSDTPTAPAGLSAGSGVRSDGLGYLGGTGRAATVCTSDCTVSP